MIEALYIVWALFCVPAATGRGLLLLYRPRDITMDCAFSEKLRYDLSFGMGMSDTLTLVFRTMTEIDYECVVEIATENRKDVYLLMVIRFPTSIGFNCYYNPGAFTVFKKEDCLRLCDEIGSRDLFSPFFTVSVTKRMRFRFTSNSSINSDINAYQYEVTATSARKVYTADPCDKLNETVCEMGHEHYCFTSGVVCDGIKNCGVPDWYDERKADCELPVERLGYNPVVAVTAALLCALLAATHILLKCLPPLANSFFIFNANEDNRFCIIPVFRTADNQSSDIENVKRNSIIPVDSVSSLSSEVAEHTKELDAVATAQSLENSKVVGTSTSPVYFYEFLYVETNVIQEFKQLDYKFTYVIRYWNHTGNGSSQKKEYSEVNDRKTSGEIAERDWSEQSGTQRDHGRPNFRVPSLKSDYNITNNNL